MLFRYRREFGYTHDEVLGMPWADVLTDIKLMQWEGMFSQPQEQNKPSNPYGIPIVYKNPRKRR